MSLFNESDQKFEIFTVEGAIPDFDLEEGDLVALNWTTVKVATMKKVNTEELVNMKGFGPEELRRLIEERTTPHISPSALEKIAQIFYSRERS